MMKVVMIVPSLANKGPIIVAKDLCTEYVKLGFICKVYYFDNIVQLKMPCPTERISFWHKIDFRNWDVVHSHGLRPDLYIRFHNWFLCKRPIFITTLHNPISYSSYRTAYNPLVSAIGSILSHVALTAMDHIVVLNSHALYGIKCVNKRNLSVIHNGRNITFKSNVITEDFAQIIALKQQYKIIGTVSSIDVRKNLVEIVSALQYMPNYAFVAVGTGPQLNELKNLSLKLGVSSRCHFSGYQENSLCYYQYFDVFVMCSISEGYPLALIEAMSFGLPIVLSDIPILTSIIKGPVLEFYSIGNLHDLCSKIEKVVDRNKYYSEKAKNYYERYLTASIMASKYISLYKRLIMNE